MKVIPPPTVPIAIKDRLLMDAIWYRWFSEGASGAGIAPGLQGTYQPTLLASVTQPTVTYSHREGFWIRLGQIVSFHVHIILSAFSGGSGSAGIDLPLVAHAPSVGDYDPTFPVYTSNVDWGTGKQFLYARVISGTPLMEFISVANNASAVSMAIGGFSAGSELAISATYWTDAP